MASSNNSPNGNGVNGSQARPRAEWITGRRAEAQRNLDSNVSQMHFARSGKITEEMKYVAWREKLSPQLVRDEVP